MPSLSFWSAFCRSYFCIAEKSSSKSRSCSSLGAGCEKEEDGACGRVENGGSKVAWGPEFHHCDHQKCSGNRKKQIPGLHCWTFPLRQRPQSHHPRRGVQRTR